MCITNGQAKRAIKELVDVGKAVTVAVVLVVVVLVLVHAEVARHHTIGKFQRTHRAQVHGAGQALAHQRCVGGLVHGHAAKQLRGVLVELDTPVVTGTGLLATIQGGAGEVARKATNVDLGSAAALALGGQARQARNGFGDGRIGQLADVFGRN